ncbi:MAG: hypothetical protein IPM54_01590 [Polyangiaceae bacterium]|nr:hypothetical protein [Polyangiaceae bacterium]
MRSRIPFIVAFLLCAETAMGADPVRTWEESLADWTLDARVPFGADGFVLGGGASLARTPEIRVQGAIEESVVFQDPDYDSHWVEDSAGVARWFVRRGFVQKNVVELHAWLEEKITNSDAIGTSVVFAMGVAPTSIVHAPYDDCLLSRYVESGGRVVWLSNVPMYVAQGEMGPKIILGSEPQRQMLGLSTDPQTFYGAEGPTLTQMGQSWGLEPVNSLTRPVKNIGLSACFFSDPAGEYCGVGLVNLRPDAPLSGFIFMPDPLDPSKEALLRNAYRLATWSGSPVTIPPPSALEAEALPFTASLRFGEDDTRSTFARGDTVPIYLRIQSRGRSPLDTSAALTVTDGSKTLTKWVGPVRALPLETDVLLDELDLGGLRRGVYEATITIAPGISIDPDFNATTSFVPDAVTLTRDLRVAPIPDHEGTHVALWASASPSPTRTAHLLDWLADHHLEPHFTDDDAVGRDLAMWHGMSFSVRRLGESANAPAPPGYDSWRRGANGEIMQVAALGNERVAKGYANPFRRQMEADDFGRRIAFDNQFPAFRRRAMTSDDYSQWFGIDYNRFVTEGFHDRFGIEAPRPATLGDSSDIGKVVPPLPGIIPDDDPWILLNRYWCEDIHGDTARRLSQAMHDNTDGLGMVGQISGGMQIPVMQLQSAQYPPYFMGDKGYSLISFYYYNRLWQPPLAHVWWLEVARMGNRGREQWIMPDSGYEGENASAIYDHFGWLMLAGGAKGIQYFNYDSMSPGGIQAMATFGGISKEYGRLLAELLPAPKKVALLVPFEQLLYKPTSSYELLYPFMDLLQAKVDVEPVSPDELDATSIQRYEAVIVAQTSWLTQSTATLLSDYAQTGGKLILDEPSGQALAIAGATQLPMRIGGASIYETGNATQIAQVKTMLGSIVQPPVNCDDPNVTFRRFDAAGVPYLYVNHNMTGAEYLAYRQSNFQDDRLAEKMGYGSDVVAARIVRPNDMRVPFDVFARKALPVELHRGMMQFVVPLPKWQGRLLAFLPEVPRRLQLAMPPKVAAGAPIPLTARLVGRRGNVDAPFPLHVTVTDPNGQRSEEYGRRLLARSGVVTSHFEFADNDVAGRWTIAVRDALTGLEATTTFELVKDVPGRIREWRRPLN